MRFDSKSVLLNDGLVIQTKLQLPNIFDNVIIPPGVWDYAVKRFNQTLNERATVTTMIGNRYVDILCLGDEKTLSMAVRREDVPMVSSMWFSIKGQIIFKQGSNDTLDEITISEIIHRDEAGVEHKLLNKS